MRLPVLSPAVPVILVGIAGAARAAYLDLRRRRLRISRVTIAGLLTALDVASMGVTAGTAAGLLFLVATYLTFVQPLYLFALFAFEAVATVGIGLFLWREGRLQVQFQRPIGIVFAEFLVLVGAYELVEPHFFFNYPGFPLNKEPTLFWAAWVFCGGAIITVIVPQFLKRREEHRIIERVTTQGEAIQAEYTPATSECPHPERWKMLDSMTAEVEVLDFLKSLVVTVKPELVVETGTFMGLSAIKMAEGMKANGFGRIVTCEFDPVVFQKAKERIAASGLAAWIECRNESSLDMKIYGTIDIFFSDSDIPIREKEIRKFLPQINPNGIVVTHDASSHYKIVREAALRLEQEGLLSVVLVATPRGLVIAQKREGRK